VDSLMTVLKELSKYKLHLVGVQEVRWGGGGLQTCGRIHIFYRKGNKIMNWVQVFLCIRESY
jgi:hypothetical protein